MAYWQLVMQRPHAGAPAAPWASCPVAILCYNTASARPWAALTPVEPGPGVGLGA